MSRGLKSRAQRAVWSGSRGAVHAAAGFVFALLLAFPLGPSAVTEPADASGTRTELVDKRTEASKTFRNANGTYTTSLFSEPVHYKSSGAWSEISSRVVPVTDTPGYSWRNEANAFRIRFRDRSTDDYLQLERGGRSVTSTLAGAAASRAAVHGSSLTYKRVFPGVDLRYDLTWGGAKETLILGDAGVPHSYRFFIDGAAPLSAKRLPSGGWIVNSPRSPRLLELAPPTLEESTRKLGGRRARRSAVQMDVKSVGDRLAVDLNVDRAWLQNPDRNFPVLLDPTIKIQPPTKEGNFDVSCGTCTSYGSPLWIGTTDTEAWRATLQFNLNALPPGAQINSASLGLYHDSLDCVYTTSGICGQSSHTLNVHRLNKAWNETSTTTNGLGWDATALGSYTLAANAPSGWMSWDVKNQLQNWVTGTQTNFGFLVKRSTEPLNVGGPVVPGVWADPASRAPKLDVNYTSDAVKLFKPETLHSNGADLRWSAYAYPDGHAFQSYEVHRSSSATFTPSASTLVATIGDVAVTSYRDTTAAPSKTFTYKILTNGWSSYGQTVTLPADGQATKTLQLTPTASATYVESVTDTENCMNYGVDEYMMIGADTDGGTPPWLTTYRPLVHFDIRDIPTDATITSANLQLYADLLPPAQTVTINVHRATSAWKEGTGLYECTGDGATWEETEGGIPWTTRGGDFDPTVVASKSRTATQTNPAWDTYAVGSAVQQWVSGQAPNHGFLLKFANETPAMGHWFAYGSDDYMTVAQRPKLAITYTDGSHAQGPTVALSEPAPSALVSGTTSPITASASDDGRVTQVEFLVDGVLKGTDSTAPYTGTWDTNSVVGGAHTITARATDDAGNVTTSAGVPVTVENSALPTTSVTAPANAATVTGTVTVTANAFGGRPISRVEFLADGVRYAEDVDAPYSAYWNTLDPNQTAYDGPHVLTTKAYDSVGREVTSANVNVTVANTAGTRYDAEITSTEEPVEVEFDPDAGTQEDYRVDLTIQNESGTTWTGTEYEVHYRWYSPDETPVVTDGPAVPLGADLAPGQTRTLTVRIQPPNLPYGVDQAQYRLEFDIWDKIRQCWFARKGNKPKENAVIVNKKLMQALGIEPYYQYVSEQLGAGMTHQVNVANGNSIVHWTPFSAPGRGLDTVLSMTYNSLEHKNSSPIGENWSLAISSLTRFGSPIDVHPNDSDDDDPGKWISLTDADGTTHKFTGRTAADGKAYYEEPAGTHLFLRQHSTTDMTRKWALTTPDRVTFFYDSRGYPTSVEDRNGNRLTFVLGAIPNGGDDEDEDEDDDGDDDEDGQRKRIVEVVDAGGRKFTLTYFSKREATKRHLRGKIKRITDHSGSPLDFEYYNDGNLLRIIQRGGTNADGSYLADRSLVFTYTTSSGSGPAIPNAAYRVNPNPKTSNQSTRLYSVRDPRGNETTFAYVTSGQNKWKLLSRTDRAGAVTSFDYDITNRVTTVTGPLSRVTKYGYDTQGSATSITNPLNQVTTQTWSPDRMLTKVTEPTGKYVEFAYNTNGLRTDEWDQLRNHTTYEYAHMAVDANDVAGKWKTGRSIPHLSQVTTKTDPEGEATQTAGDYRWSFAYDQKGNITGVTDPEGYATTDSLNSDGTVATSKDAKGRTTVFVSYDANGLPAEVRDPLGHTIRYGYDSDGQLVWHQDALHESETGSATRTYRHSYDYDSFHRLGIEAMPKSTTAERGNLIWKASEYDANGNLVSQIGEQFGAQYTKAGAMTRIAYDAMDRHTLITNPDTSADAAGERTRFTYDAAGRITELTLPKGVATPAPRDKDFAVLYSYDLLDRAIRETRHEQNDAGAITKTWISHNCYDATGDLRWAVAPNAGLSSVDCNAQTPPSHTTRYMYDAAHRVLSETNALGRTATLTYDANGDVKTVGDESGNLETYSYNQRGDRVKLVEPLRKDDNGAVTRSLTTAWEYDGVGNVTREISPRAWDLSPNKTTFTTHVTDYSYDAGDRLIKVALPADGVNARAYLHNRFDANGNITMSSLPVEISDPALTPLPEKQRTLFENFDTGLVRTIQEPASAKVHFDYTAEGWQSSRTPESDDGTLDTAQQVRWEYYADGKLKKESDRRGHSSTYVFDANGNMTRADEGRGLIAPSQTPYEVLASYDQLDQLSKVRQKQRSETHYRFTAYGYDLNGNVVQRTDDGRESVNGSVVDAGQSHEFSYNQDNRLKEHVARAAAGCSDDLRITRGYSASGLETSEVIERAGAGCTASTPAWTTRQATEVSYFANDDFATSIVKNGAGATMASHSAFYEDGNGIYQNGNPTKDVFRLVGPDTSAPCVGAACSTSYGYDARDRLIEESRERGSSTFVTRFGLDPAGNIKTETSGGTTRTFEYEGNQLKTISAAGAVRKVFHDGEGNLDCVTTDAWAGSECPVAAQGGTPHASLLQDYVYDYQNRLAGFRRFSASAPLDSADYTYDPFDRLVEETETHPGASATTTATSYIGLSGLAGVERQSGGSSATRSFAYDDQGKRATLTHDSGSGSSQSYTYSRNARGDTELLLDAGGNAKATYGYKSHGGDDASVSRGDAKNQDALNLFRFSDRRHDTGSETVDMGARRLDLDTAQFIQRDGYADAHADAALSTDPLTQNRYALAAANPVGLVDADGHAPSRAQRSRAFWRQYWREHTERHDTALMVTFWEISRRRPGALAQGDLSVAPNRAIPGAGRRVGTVGFPDIMLEDGGRTYIWEIKPDTPYGHATGPAQLARYTNAIGRRALPGFYMPGQRFGFTSRDWLTVRSGLGPVESGIEFYRAWPRIPFRPVPHTVPRTVPKPAPPSLSWRLKWGIIGGAAAVTATVTAATCWHTRGKGCQAAARVLRTAWSARQASLRAAHAR